ncbi:hypothetical protein DL768_008752 [Monosporascus sp. mg162]|nr:hypothetical protein DL768_008752 [Monosporascus sp. mg162]
MDDSLEPPNIFESANSFWDFTQNVRPVTKPSIGFEGAGLKCEVRRYDSVFNAKGERVVVSSGTRFNLSSDRDSKSYQSSLVLTKFWSRSGDEEYTELEIRSPHMKAAIKAIVPEFKDADIDTKHITLRDEPRCIFHYRHELFNYGLCMELSSQIYTWTVMVELAGDTPPCLDFPNLWMLFRSDDLIYVTNAASPTVGKTSRVFKFQSMSRCKCDREWCRNKDWIISGLCIDYDGSAFGHRVVRAKIPFYEGFRQLSELLVLPLHFHPDQDAIRSRLIARGKKFTEMHSQHYQRYRGVAEVLGNDRNVTVFGEEDEFPLQATWINGRVMIDTRTFCEARPSHEPYINMDRKTFVSVNGAPPEMAPDELIICHHMVAGFAFNEKHWGFFEVDFIEDIPYDSDAFRLSLILNQEYKRMILSLVEVHQDEGAQFDDFMAGKGKGVIFLLHGEPGTGKTLTAESVADHCKKPLLRIDASLLGTTAKSVERGLASAFQLAEKWKAVALLDEADVFLQQRSASDLERNSLVSVFLRMMEYYEGLLFLTTNRIESFDRAFKSRIHLAILFPKLDWTSRRQLWAAFLTRATQKDASRMPASSSIDGFASEDLNGRQIKNIVKVARALAVKDPSRSMEDNVESAIRAMRSFDQDFSSTQAERDEGYWNSSTGRGGRSGHGHEGAKRRRIEE